MDTPLITSPDVSLPQHHTRISASFAILGWTQQQRKKLTSSEAAERRWDPVYLFFCGVLWRSQGDTAAGWELIHALRSWDGQARAIAAASLSHTEHARLLVRDLRRTTSGFNEVSDSAAAPPGPQISGKVQMNTPYGLEIIDSCLSCKLRKDKWFCRFSPDFMKSFSAAGHLGTYPGKALLFVEGQMPRGAYVLCSGKVKLSTTSRDGKILILKIAEAGEVLGLSAAISGTPFEVTAETAGPCQVNFIEREALMRLMEKNGEMGLHSAQALSKEFQIAYRDMHELVLARSSTGKLARLLLSWTIGRDPALNELRVRSSLTHEEMAQMIGSSRETVTRLLSHLKRKELIRLEGSTLVIRNKTALEALAA
ncbi:MAG: Crp/Fnr family transcriptional regulator [Acidobacteriaceae bacterium]